jgi:luciferase family oxidoreductase group 1
MSVTNFLPLSVLDVSPVPRYGTGVDAFRNTLELAIHTENLGYRRFWLAEHHNMNGLAGVAPEILIGVIAQHTQRIRLGAGAVLLPNYAPLKVAELFRTLEALTPGRIDLGIGRAPRQDPRTALALRGSEAALLAHENIAQQVAELEGFAEVAPSPFPEDHPLREVIAVPEGVPFPPIFLLGSGQLSATIAAERGRGFAAAYHFSPLEAESAIKNYKACFKPSCHFAKPYAIVSVSVIAAESEDLAAGLAKAVQLSFLRRVSNVRAPFPSIAEAKEYSFNDEELEKVRPFTPLYGTPTQVHKQLTELAHTLQADELQITTIISDHNLRLRSYELLADVFKLGDTKPRAERDVVATNDFRYPN